MVTAIILAAGQGRRMQSSVPKQFLEVDGEPVIVKTLRVFELSREIDSILLVTAREYTAYCSEQIVEKYGFRKVARIVEGGRERYDSVWNALMACEELYGWKSTYEAGRKSRDFAGHYVMIHDGARPFVTEDILRRTKEAVEIYQAAAVGMPSKDTVKIADAEGFAAETPPRAKVWLIQTPQAFSYPLIVEANRRLMAEGRMSGVTDDAMIVEASGLQKVKLVEGSYGNVKLTTPEDLWRL